MSKPHQFVKNPCQQNMRAGSGHKQGRQARPIDVSARPCFCCRVETYRN